MSCRNTGGQASANYKEVTVGTGVICRTGSRPGFQQLPHSVHDLRRRRLAGDHVPPRTPNIKGSRPCYSPLASSTTQRQCLLLQDLQCDLLNRELSPVPLVSFSLTLDKHMHRSWEINRETRWRGVFFLCPAAEPGPRGESKRERERKHVGNRNCITVNLTPFTPFRSPFSSESRVKITLWLRLWSCNTKRGGGGRTQRVIMWLLSWEMANRSCNSAETDKDIFVLVNKSLRNNGWKYCLFISSLIWFITLSHGASLVLKHINDPLCCTRGQVPAL